MDSIYVIKNMKNTKCFLCDSRVSVVSFQIVTIICMISSTMCLNYECIPSNTQVNVVGVANCSSQQLAHIPPNLPHNIKILDLSHNFINTLQDYSFVKYENLRKLFLQNISLSKVEDDAFVRMRRLSYMDLSFNNLGFLPSKAFENIPEMKSLSLKGNKIQQLSINAFSGIPKLRSLNLAGNHIQIIHPLAFSGLSLLQRLELQNNALTTLNSSVFSYFSQDLREIKLFNNPWYCDCRLRWIVQWLQNASDARSGALRWRYNLDQPLCHGPAIIEQRPFATLTGDLFLCPIRMYSNANNKLDLEKGSEVELFCKYMADPHVDMMWLKDGKKIDLKQNWKYDMETHVSDVILTSRLYIFNFQYEDIGEYECYAENKLGKVFDTCLLGLEGVDMSLPREITEGDDRDKVRNAIIAASTIGGVVIVIILIGVTFFLLMKCKRYQKKKKESIRMSFEEHLKANGIIDENPKCEPKLYDEAPDGSMSIDAEMEECESVYDSLQQPRVPSSVNTNTYISFKTEFSEPEDMSQLYSSQSQQISSNCKGSDGSQCESTSPLLENISPILIDPNDPFYEANLYVPRLHSVAGNYLSSMHNGHYDDQCPIPHDIRILPHNGHVIHDDVFAPYKSQTLPHGYYPRYSDDFGSFPVVRSNSVSVPHHKSASVGHLGLSPPKKPPRLFHSRDTMSLHSQTIYGDRDTGLQLSLPKPGTVDKYGTAV